MKFVWQFGECNFVANYVHVAQFENNGKKIGIEMNVDGERHP